MTPEEKIRDKARREVSLKLSRLAYALVHPMMENWNVYLWDPNTLETTPHGKAVLNCLINIPDTTDDIPDILIDVEMERLIDQAIGGAQIVSADADLYVEPEKKEKPEPEKKEKPEPEKKEDKPEAFVLPTPPPLKEGILPPNMEDRYAVPRYNNNHRLTMFRKTVKEGDCWIWQGGRARTTPQYKSGGNRSYHARRSSLWLFKGHYTKQRIIKSTCDDPYCINPDHAKMKEYEPMSMDNAFSRS